MLADTELQSLTGSVVSKIQIDDNDHLHVAFSVNTGGFGIFSDQLIHYANCSASCTDLDSWSTGLVFTLNRSILEQEAQSIDWFAITADGNPRLAFISPTGSFIGDMNLYYFSCNEDCSQPDNWSQQIVTELNLASSTPAHLLISDEGHPMIIATDRTVGAFESSLLYFECQSFCESNNPMWSEPVEIQALSEEPFVRNAISPAVVDGKPMIALFKDGDEFVLSLWSCDQNCTSVASWNQNVLNSALPLPESVASLSPIVDLRYDNGMLYLGLVGKDRTISYSNRVMQFSCSGSCFNNQWSHQTLLDTSTIEFDDQGICLFIGTTISDPLQLSSGAFSFEMVPQWACSTFPVQITDENGNVFIDNSADIRFFEFAAFGLSN